MSLKEMYLYNRVIKHYKVVLYLTPILGAVFGWNFNSLGAPRFVDESWYDFYL